MTTTNDIQAAMLAAWQPIDTAPRGTTRSVATPKGNRETWVAQWVWTCRTSDGHVTRSHWEPEADRWSAYTQAAGPDLWQAIVVPMAPGRGA